MNPEAQVVLEKILAKDKSTLTGDEKAFLRARRSYLNDEQTKRFADVLDDSDETSSPFDSLTLPALKKLAEENEVDLTGASKKPEVIAKLVEAGVEAPSA